MITVAALIIVTNQPFTTFNFGSNLMLLGAIACTVGSMATVGSFNILGNWRYQFGRSVSYANLQERSIQDVHVRADRERFSIIISVAGVIAIMSGYAIQGLVR